MSKDYRYNPFSDSAEAVSLTELYQVPAASPYNIRLNEVPEQGDPSTIVVKEVTAISGVTRTYGQTFTEVAAVPASGSFRPDYNTKADSDDKWNTGTLLFAAADAGKLVEVTYNGLGTLASVKAPGYPAWFTDRGDGSDGDYAPIASTTLAGGTYNFKSVNIPSGVTITLTGCVEIKCLGAFTCAGIITANGANGQSYSSGGSLAGGGGCNGYLPNKGGDNVIGTSAGVVGSTGYGGGIGGASGAGYESPAGAGGGVAGSSLLDLLSPVVNRAYVLFAKKIICGAGGGGAANSGGSGGGGGASIYITAHSVNITGSITANGGNGGNGRNSSTIGSRAGAGGGGGGGAVVIVADTISNTGTISANGGTGGTQTNNTAYAGVAGANGIVYLKELGAA